MALPPNVIKQWAQGRKAEKPEDEDEDDASLGLEGDESEEDAAPHQSIWAGEHDPEEIDEESAGDCMDWLEDNEPEIYDAVHELAKALVDDDDRMIQHAEDELLTVKQYLTPEYPEFTDAQRKAAPDAIRAELSDSPADGTPEFRLATIRGLAKVRQEEPEEDEEGEEDDLDEADETESGLTA